MVAERPANRTGVKTAKEHQTPDKVEPKVRNDSTNPPAATAALRARGKKAWWPCMMPSATKVTPFNSCRAAPMAAGARPASVWRPREKNVE